jgi:predicted deacylase
MTMRRTLLLMFIVSSATLAADLAIGTATARPGQKSTGALTVPAGVDAATSIPVIVVNGAKPGPTLALVAGAHGTEYASIIALEKLAQIADPTALSGALIIVPLVNVASFAQKVPHLNPVDNKNMNRFFPGKADGTQTERASYALGKQVVEKCDYLIDFHGGDLDENLRRYSYWAQTGKEKLDATSHGMVLAFGLDHIILQNFRMPVAAGGAVTLTRFATDVGKPAIAVEAGQAGRTNAEDVDVLVEGVQNVMRHLKMLPGSVTPVEHPIWLARSTTLNSQYDGIFYPLALPEAYVSKGMTIGYLTDYVGNKIWDVPSPVSGVIIYIGAVPSMKKGDSIAVIGEPAENP